VPVVFLLVFGLRRLGSSFVYFLHQVSQLLLLTGRKYNSNYHTFGSTNQLNSNVYRFFCGSLLFCWRDLVWLKHVMF